jgi:hypothetical protein
MYRVVENEYVEIKKVSGEILSRGCVLCATKKKDGVIH